MKQSDENSLLVRQMNANSLLVWSKTVEPQLTAREVQVFEVIEELFPTTLEGIAKSLNVPEHTVSGRITGLKKKKLIKVVGREMGAPAGRTSAHLNRSSGPGGRRETPTSAST